MTENTPLTRRQLDVLLNEPNATCLDVGLTSGRRCQKGIKFKNTPLGRNANKNKDTPRLCDKPWSKSFKESRWQTKRMAYNEAWVELSTVAPARGTEDESHSSFKRHDSYPDSQLRKKQKYTMPDDGSGIIVTVKFNDPDKETETEKPRPTDVAVVNEEMGGFSMSDLIAAADFLKRLKESLEKQQPNPPQEIQLSQSFLSLTDMSTTSSLTTSSSTSSSESQAQNPNPQPPFAVLPHHKVHSDSVTLKWNATCVIQHTKFTHSNLSSTFKENKKHGRGVQRTHTSSLIRKVFWNRSRRPNFGSNDGTISSNIDRCNGTVNPSCVLLNIYQRWYFH
jgi:hypothetical protein